MDTSELLTTYEWPILVISLCFVTLFCITRSGYFPWNYGGILFLGILIELFLYEDSNAFKYIIGCNFGAFVFWSATYTRVIERVSGWARYWSYLGEHGDQGLQESLSSRLKAQQRANRKRKYLRQNGATEEGIEERSDQFFTRLSTRCERALASRWNFEGPVYTPGETAESVSRDIDLNKRCGKEIYRWLVREIKESEGFVVPVKWLRDRKTGGIKCHNGYINKAIHEDFFASGDDLTVGSISVLKPNEIRPALLLIETALDFIEFYKTTGFVNNESNRLRSHQQFQRAVAVKCEFKRYPAEYKRGSIRTLDVDNLNWKETQKLDGTTGGDGDRYVEKDRELVSLLTVSVDRYLVVTFHIAYMLEHPTDTTCTEMNRLFHDLILNSRKIKIWHNLPNCIGALDSTLEHIFRGSRPTGDDVRGLARYRASLRKPFRETPNDFLRIPHYKDTGPDDLLQMNRPPDTEFDRTDRPCPLNLHAPGVDYAGRSCPCDKGILDITSLADYILRQHCITKIPEIKDGQRVITPLKASWTDPANNHSFLKLAQWLLAGSKYQPLLCRFRTVSHEKPQKPSIWGLGEAVAKEVMNIYYMKLAIYTGMKAQFYTTSGETKGVEKDDICLAYIVGDAIGLALIFRNLITSESPSLLAERLSHYALKNTYEVKSYAYETVLFRKPVEPIQLPPLEQPNFYTIGLEVDIPPAAPSDAYIDVYQRLAGRPEWWMRKDTFYKTESNISFSSVIATGFIHTGWEYPLKAIARRRERTLPPAHEDPADISAQEGNHRQPLGVRNLAATILQNNLGNIPEEFARVLHTDFTNISNGAWFEVFMSLLLWHCGLENLGLPEEEMALILPNRSSAEEKFLTGFEVVINGRVREHPEDTVEVLGALPVPVGGVPATTTETTPVPSEETPLAGATESTPIIGTAATSRETPVPNTGTPATETTGTAHMPTRGTPGAVETEPVPINGAAATAGTIPLSATAPARTGGTGEVLAISPPNLTAGEAATAEANQIERNNFVDGVCTEILIYMLVKEISTFEELDTARKLVLGLDKMAQEYSIRTGVSLYSLLRVRRILTEYGIDNLCYQEPYWFKRLQVLLGHEFVERNPLNSPYSRICYECGAKNRAELVVMLIGELRRFLHLYRLQEELKPALDKICQSDYRHRWARNLLPITNKRSGPMLDRREPTHRVDKRNTWAEKYVATTPATLEPMTEAEGLEAARRKVSEWTIPRWYASLLGDESHLVTAALTPQLQPHAEFPKPRYARVHSDWLEAVIILLHLNPETGPGAWHCIRKMWSQGLYIQGLKMADENVQHFILPSLELITASAAEVQQIANYGVDQVSVHQRRTYNLRSRARTYRALQSDIILSKKLKAKPRNPRVNQSTRGVRRRPEVQNPPSTTCRPNVMAQILQPATWAVTTPETPTTMSTTPQALAQTTEQTNTALGSSPISTGIATQVPA